jgi:hypothetical protein
MLNYKPLPEFINKFIIKPENPFDLVKDIKGHNWTTYNTKNFITEEGQDWFEKNKIVLIDTSQYFICNENTTGPVHLDNPCTVAFNFVFEGTGNMQWITVLDGDISYHTNIVQSGEKFIYKKFANLRSINIDESWDGTSALVRVNVPHRVVTKDGHRICLSIRPDIRKCRLTFDEMCQIIDNE